MYCHCRSRTSFPLLSVGHASNPTCGISEWQLLLPGVMTQEVTAEVVGHPRSINHSQGRRVLLLIFHESVIKALLRFGEVHRRRTLSFMYQQFWHRKVTPQTLFNSWAQVCPLQPACSAAALGSGCSLWTSGFRCDSDLPSTGSQWTSLLLVWLQSKV